MPLDGSSLEMLSPHLGRSENRSRSQIGETGPGEGRLFCANSPARQAYRVSQAAWEMRGAKRKQAPL